MKNTVPKGFTLIELMIVMAIISGLATLFVASYPSALKRARDTHRRNDIKQYQTALEAYANNNSGLYPVIAIPSNIYTTLCGVGDPLENYPCTQDPKIGQAICGGGISCRYWYVSNAGGTDYAVWATLEKPTVDTDPLFISCSNGKTYEGDVTPTSVNVCPG